MPLNPDLGGQTYDSSRKNFPDKIIECFARYCLEHDEQKYPVGDTSITGREYVQELVNMRGGDIFMGAIQRRTSDVQSFRLSFIRSQSAANSGSADAILGGAISAEQAIQCAQA